MVCTMMSYYTTGQGQITLDNKKRTLDYLPHGHDNCSFLPDISPSPPTTTATFMPSLVTPHTNMNEHIDANFYHLQNKAFPSLRNSTTTMEARQNIPDKTKKTTTSSLAMTTSVSNNNNNNSPLFYIPTDDSDDVIVDNVDDDNNNSAQLNYNDHNKRHNNISIDDVSLTIGERLPAIMQHLYVDSSNQITESSSLLNNSIHQELPTGEQQETTYTVRPLNDCNNSSGHSGEVKKNNLFEFFQDFENNIHHQQQQLDASYQHHHQNMPPATSAAMNFCKHTTPTRTTTRRENPGYTKDNHESNNNNNNNNNTASRTPATMNSKQEFGSMLNDSKNDFTNTCDVITNTKKTSSPSSEDVIKDNTEYNGNDSTRVGDHHQCREHDERDQFHFDFPTEMYTSSIFTKKKRFGRLKRSATNDESMFKSSNIQPKPLSRCNSIDCAKGLDNCKDSEYFTTQKPRKTTSKRKLLRRSVSLGFSKFKLISSFNLRTHQRLPDDDITIDIKETEYQTSRRKNTNPGGTEATVEKILNANTVDGISPSQYPPLLRSLSAPETLEQDEDIYDEDISELYLPRRRAICPNLPVPAMKQLKTYLILTRLKQYCFV